MKKNKIDVTLYAITDSSNLGGKTLAQKAEEAIKGGATTVQLRDKQKSGEELLGEAKEICAICKKYDVTFIMNDSPEIALECGADGVHVGQDDESLENARKILGADKIIGVSTHNVKEAVSAMKGGADYIGAGAVFVTGTKKDATPLDHKVLAQMCESVDIPVVAIGGISEQNAHILKGTGIDGIAVISAVFGKENTLESAKNLKKIAQDIKND